VFLIFPELLEPRSRPKVEIVSADDHHLIAACLRGDTSAFGVLVRRYQDRLYNTVYRLVDNAEDAQDVVQDAFFSAYQSLESFKGDSLFFTWLYRIAINTAISFKRKNRVMVRLESPRNGENGAMEPSDTSDENQPGYSLEQQEQGQRIHQALKRLSAEHRAVLIMKDMEGEKYENMAEILGVPVGTIRSRLHRARLELREILEQTERV
jgi:RNA polymerase sigma-70 factor (ECF subfamily)